MQRRMRLTEEQLRTYLLQLTTTRASATVTQALFALRFFDAQTLGRHWTILDLARPPRDKQLPAVLSREEVSRELSAIADTATRIKNLYCVRLRQTGARGPRR